MTRARLIVHGGYTLTIAAILAGLWLNKTNVPEAYHQALLEHTKELSDVKWLGVPIWQPLPDVWTLQEAIAEVRPSLLIECGTYRGGSSYFIAQLFDLLNHGRVITVDIVKQHDLSHPRVTYLIGPCASDEIVRRIRAEAGSTGGPIMVLLDSDHSAANVTRELEAYAPLVTPGSYVHVQDGAVDLLERYRSFRPGPLVAIEAFLPMHPEFELDAAKINRFPFTHHPKGWLKRRAAEP
jgi:cephalosporin hydroxylase